MWYYEKRLEYPVNISITNAKLAQFIMSQYGGPDTKRISYIACPTVNANKRREK